MAPTVIVVIVMTCCQSHISCGVWLQQGHMMFLVTYRLILGMSLANERRCYFVMPSLIWWAHTHTDPWHTTDSNNIAHYSTLLAHPSGLLHWHWGNLMIYDIVLISLFILACFEIYLTIYYAGIILSMHTANKRQHYDVTSSVIGWACAEWPLYYAILIWVIFWANYHQTSNIICTWVGHKIVDHSDVVGASPVGAAPTTSSFST